MATSFTNNIASGRTGTISLTADRALVTDGTPVISASVTTSSEISYLSGVTSSVQTQIDTKANYLPCLVATVFNLNATYVDPDLTNAGTQIALAIDGITLQVGDRVLVKNQSTLSLNGIYTVTNVGSGATNWVLTRATEMPDGAEITLGKPIFVARGTVNSVSFWGVFGSSNDTGVDDIFFSNMYYQAARTTLQMGFRLTLTSNIPVTTADLTAATTVYMTPYLSGLISLYDSNVAIWMLYSTAQISVSPPANTNTPFDVFAYLSTAGVVTLEAVAWTNATTRATALTLQNSILVKSGTVARRYIGTLCTTGVSGETQDSAAKRFCYNYYNRIPKSLNKLSNDTSWTYASNTIRQANADTENQVAFVMGASEDIVDVVVHTMASGSTGTGGMIALALDSTTSVASSTEQSLVTNITGGRLHMSACYRSFPGIGSRYIAWVEASDGTTTFRGADSISGLGCKYGINGTIWC